MRFNTAASPLLLLLSPSFASAQAASVASSASLSASSASSAASAASSSASVAALSASSSASSGASAAATGLSERLSSLWDKVTPYLPSAGSFASSSFASTSTRQLVNLTAQNWAETLDSSSSSSIGAVAPTANEHPWLVLISGGNQTCGGACGQLDAAWALAAAQGLREARAPNLGFVDCETNRLLCATWGAEPASAWWIEPARYTLRSPEAVDARVAAKEADVVDGKGPLEAKARSVLDTKRDIYVVPLNTTTVGADDITRLYRKGEYKTRGQLLDSESLLSRHPYDGQLARYGLNIPVGYVYFATGMVPSWTFIMMLSVTMRLFMSNRARGPKETKEEKALRERQAKYTADGKVRGAPPGDGRSAGVL